MDAVLTIAILILLASVAVIVGTLVFAVWAVQYFGRRAYRQATRRHLYAPVDARVTRVLYHLHCATLYVVYEFGRAKIVNRFLTTHDAARLAEQSKQVELLIDPDYPKDVVVAPAFEVQAAAAPKPPGWGTPLGAKSFSGYALRLLVCLLLGGCVAVGLGWLQHGTVDPLLLVVLAAYLPLTYVICLLAAFPLFKARKGDCLDQLEEEKRKAPRSSA